MTDTGHRLRLTGWIASVTSLALWAVSTFSLVYRVFVVGLSADQQRAVEQFPREPLEAIVEPLIAMTVATTLLGVLTVVSLLYYSYAQWRSARLERIALERGFEE